MKRVLVKVLMVAAALAVIGFLFIRSVRSTREEPYSVQAAHLQNWELAMEAGDTPASAVLSLRAPRELAASLFRQLFTRHAESFNGTVPSIALLLQEEFTRSFSATTTPGELLEWARASALAASSFTPRCMAYRRDAAPGVTRQLYFVVYDAPAFQQFREALAAKAAPQSGYDPAALSPVMLVAGSDANFQSWMPIRVNEADCVAPIDVQGSSR